MITQENNNKPLFFMSNMISLILYIKIVNKANNHNLIIGIIENNIKNNMINFDHDFYHHIIVGYIDTKILI